LIELIAVLAIIGLLASISLPRFIDLDQRSGRQVLLSAVSELNGRESLAWSKVKISQTGWIDDAGVFREVDTGLGADFRWTPRAAISGGNLHFKEQMLRLEREPSLMSRAGRWRKR
jgi:hypothetical protein